MSTAARKARKRAGQPYTKAPKRPRGLRPHEPRGLGLITGAEILARLIARPTR